MDRRALLIESSKLKGHDDLPGARTDVVSYARFLKSDFGGAWEDSEITVLSHPRRADLERYKKLAKYYDYSLVTFSGHGHHVKGKQIDETRLCINNDEEISVYDLNSQGSYSLVIADACRKVTYVDAEKQARAFEMALNEAEARLRPNRARCRDLFYKVLGAAEKGPIYFYSCNLDEAASDVPSFSSKLVEAGEAWAENKKEGVLASNDAFRAAATAITGRNAQQNPQSNAGRRSNHFPFAVLAY
jgi:hypothetical protein